MHILHWKIHEGTLNLFLLNHIDQAEINLNFLTAEYEDDNWPSRYIGGRPDLSQAQITGDPRTTGNERKGISKVKTFCVISLHLIIKVSHNSVSSWHFFSFVIYKKAALSLCIAKINWKSEGLHNYSNIFRWELEGWYRCPKSGDFALLVLNGTWWTDLMLFWLSADDIDFDF